MKLLKVLLVQPGLSAHLALVENNREAVTALLGGVLSIRKPWDNGIAILHNNRIPPSERTLNRLITADPYMGVAVITGCFIIYGINDDEAFCSLTDAQFAKYKKQFAIPDRFVRTPFGFTVMRAEPVDPDSKK